MSELYPQNLMSFLSILLIFLRLLGLFLLVPGFSHQAIPMPIKLVLALSLSLALYPILKVHLGVVPEGITELLLCALRETAVGFLMGFAAYVTFEAINLSAHFIGYQMGLGGASLIDPQNHASVPITVPLHGWLALMVFFLADMHHGILRLFVASFHMTGGVSHDMIVSPELLKIIVTLCAKLFWLAVQMAGPFTMLILGCNVAIGVLSRMLPQMNILLFSFPITILLGLSAMYLLAPELLSYLESVLGEISTDVTNVLRTI